MQTSAHRYIEIPGRWIRGLLLFVTVIGPLQAAPEPAGHVIIAHGEVWAVAAGGERRPLRRRSPFYAGETLVTGAGSMAQLRFGDGALLSLKPETAFRVDRYRYENAGGEGDESISTLLKGGFRTITGAIGKQDPDNYEVTTPVATIGVRGTHYEVVLGDVLAVGVWQGGIRLRNEGGELELGRNAAYRFATVAGPYQSPRGRLQPPPGLDTPPPAPAQAAGAQEQQTQASEGEGTEDAAAGDGTTSPGEEDADPGTNLTTTTTVGTDPAEDGTGPETTSDDGLDTTTTGTDTRLTGTTDTTLDATFTVTEPVDSVTDITSQDARLSDTEWQRLFDEKRFGIILEANSASRGIRGGRAVVDPGGSPVFTDTGYAPFDPQHADAPILEVFRQGNASLDALGSHAVDSNHTVYWGVWNGNTDPVIIQTDATDPGVTRTSNRPFFWATLLPTDPGVLDARTGTVTYNNVIAAQGGGSGGQITLGDVTFTLDVDFDTGALTNGSLQIGNGTEFWDIQLSGQIRGSFADLVVESGSRVTVSPTVDGVIGDIGAGFTGNNGEVLGAGFLFEAQGDSSIHAEGIFLAQ